MRHRLISTLVLAALVASACGGGDDGQQSEVADMFIELAESEGIQLDRDCVVDAAEGLSDSDAEKIVEAGTTGSADISDGASAVGDEIFNCVDGDSFRESVLNQFEEEASIDIDCLRAELAGATTVEEIEDQLFDAASGCRG